MYRLLFAMNRSTSKAIRLGLCLALNGLAVAPAHSSEADQRSSSTREIAAEQSALRARQSGFKGDGKIRFENRPIDEFTTLEASGDYEIVWSPGPPSLSVQCDRNLFSEIKTDVSEHKLKITSLPELSPTQRIRVTICSDILNDIRLDGTVRLTAKELSGDSITIHCSGAARVEADGSASFFTAKLAGTSRVHALKLTALKASLEVLGSSSVELCVAKQLKASVIGAGTITYSGRPEVDQSIAGTGQILRLK